MNDNELLLSLLTPNELSLLNSAKLEDNRFRNTDNYNKLIDEYRSKYLFKLFFRWLKLNFISFLFFISLIFTIFFFFGFTPFKYFATESIKIFTSIFDDKLKENPNYYKYKQKFDDIESANIIVEKEVEKVFYSPIKNSYIGRFKIIACFDGKCLMDFDPFQDSYIKYRTIEVDIDYSDVGMSKDNGSIVSGICRYDNTKYYDCTLN